MPDIKEIDIDRQLRAGRPSPVYLIYGEDRYRKQLSAKKLIDGLMPRMMPDINFRRLFGGRDKVSAVREACVQMPMLDGMRLTVMEDFPLDSLKSEDTRLLNDCIESLKGQCVLIIWQNDAEFDARKSGAAALVQLIRKHGSVLRLDIPTVNETARSLSELADSKGAKLAIVDANYMVRRCGRDMILLSSELDKLIVYAGRKNITQQMIDEICPASLEADVFHISKNILWGRAEDALRITGNLMLQKAKPVEIFSILSQNFVDLYRAKCAVLANKSSDELKKAFPADYTRARAFRADNAMRDQREYSLQQLRRYVELLISAELTLKGGRNDKRTCLEQLIVRLCYVRKGNI